MRDALGALAKGPAIFVLSAVALVGCAAAVLWNEWSYDPPANAEAKRREQILLAMQPTDLPVEGLRLAGEYSTAGKKDGQGPFEQGDPVHVGRWYAFTGDPIATCHAVVASLVADGWTVTGPEQGHDGCDHVQHNPPAPDLDLAASESIYVDLTFQCTGFEVEALLSLRMDATDDPPQEIELSLETDYPLEEADPRPTRCR